MDIVDAIQTMHSLCNATETCLWCRLYCARHSGDTLASRFPEHMTASLECCRLHCARPSKEKKKNIFACEKKSTARCVVRRTVRNTSPKCSAHNQRKKKSLKGIYRARGKRREPIIPPRQYPGLRDWIADSHEGGGRRGGLKLRYRNDSLGRDAGDHGAAIGIVSLQHIGIPHGAIEAVGSCETYAALRR